ncbi:MAG: YkgJ family cysteine cluster protein [Betaproteobacteria bacterium]|nr:YkgJ family cysteine cluster protein [Betaproteobacteria bacterium]
MTPEERANRIGDKDTVRRILFWAVPHVPRAARMPLAQRHEQLRQLADTAAAAIAPETPCKKGCAACCHQAVGIGWDDAQRIGAAIGRAPVRLTALTDPRENIDRYAGKPCPFLVENLCTVYDVRPLACRLHHSLENDAAPCDSTTNPGARAGMLNLAPFYMAAAELMMGEPAGDIREFFPREQP